MRDSSKKREFGFTLLEMTIAMALGTLVLGAAVQLYSQGVGATFAVSQRAEMQQDFRATANLLTKDLSLAGAGLGNGAAIALPTATTLPVYGCDQSTSCHLGLTNSTAGAFPTQSGAPFLYGLIPGYYGGPTINTPPGPTDVVTVAYTDNTFLLNCYTATVTTTTTVTFTVPSPLTCALPNGLSAPQAINDGVVGLTAGDLVLFTFGTTSAVAEIYGSTTTATTATFATNDPLKMNQPSFPNSLGSHQGAVGTATRIFLITYYIDSTTSPARLMRQISGHTPMPVTDSVVYMKFSYDLYNDSTNTIATNQPNPGSGDTNDTASNGLLPNQITKINILHMATDSALRGTKGFQGLDLETSVSARDLTYNNNYPLH
jgi:Tfp pilus assembly protein PilW